MDASSLLFRCEMLGVNVGERWEDLAESWKYLVEERVMAFNDIHILFACLGAKKDSIANKVLGSMEEYHSLYFYYRKDMER